MTRIEGRLIHHKVHCGNRTKVIHQAQRAKRQSSSPIRLQPMSAKQFSSERGSALPEVLSEILGGAAGFFVGAKIQFNALKDIIAAERDILPEKLSFWGFIFDPVYSEDYTSVMAGGLIGLILGSGILLLGHRLINRSDNGQQ